MRDSALKLDFSMAAGLAFPLVGEELMRDSALKHNVSDPHRIQKARSEKSSCATAL